jgi:aspartate aminotransferase-like enzyme
MVANLRITGPTPLPPDVREAATRQIIGHRTAEFRTLLSGLLARLAKVFGSATPILPFTTSGTGGLEAAVANTLCPGDRTVAVSIGYFGDRFTEVARAYGGDVIHWQLPWGRAAEPDDLRTLLRHHRDIKAVLFTHNETSTGTTNPLAALCKVIREETSALILVDVVSSVGAIPLDVDRNGIDVAVGVTQKALMAPPGLSLLSVSERALRVAASTPAPRFTLDFVRMARAVASGTTTYTPPVTTLYCLEAALSRIEAEGLSAVYRRHAALAAECRDGLESLGLTLAAAEDCRSATVTAARLPDGMLVDRVRMRLEREHSVSVGAGRAGWARTHLRVGHMGWVSFTEVRSMTAALERVLAQERASRAGSPKSSQ